MARWPYPLLGALCAVLRFELAAATGPGLITALSPTSITVDHATVITLTGTFQTGDLATLALTGDCGTATPDVDASSGSPTFTVTATGTYDFCYRANGQADSIAQTGLSVAAVAATSATAIVSSDPTSASINYATEITIDGASSGQTAIFAPTGTCASATPNVDISGGSGTFTLTATGVHDLCLRASGGSDSIAQTNAATQVTGVAVTSATAITAISPTSITQNRASLIALTFSGTADSGDLAGFASVGNCATHSPAVDVSSGSGTFTVVTTGTFDFCFREASGSDSVQQTFASPALTVVAATTAGAISAISPTSITAGQATTITFTGATTGDLALFATTGTDCTTALSSGTPIDIGSGTASFTLGSTGTYDLCFRATGMTDAHKQTSVSLTVQAATAATLITSISPSSVIVGVATTLQFGGTSTGDLADFMADGGDCSTITPSTDVSSGGSAGMASYTISSSGTYQLCYRQNGGTDSVKQTSVSITAVLASVAGSDPVAVLGNVRREFNLPLGVMTPLMVAPDMTISGATFQGSGPWEQWFDRMVVRSADGLRWMEVAIRKDLLSFNRSAARRNTFDSLKVTLGGSRPPDLDVMTEVQTLDTTIPFDILGADVAFRRVRRDHHTQFASIGRARRECVDFVGGYLHFYICSAGAWEYHGWQRHLSIKFAHLDLVVHEAQNLTAVTGLLPELWGLQPLSEKAAAYVLEQKTAAAGKQASPAELPQNGSEEKSAACPGAGWAGGTVPVCVSPDGVAAEKGAIVV